METIFSVRRIPLWFNRSENTHAIVTDIMKHGPLSRSQLAVTHRLSQGTLSKITNSLIEAEILREEGPREEPSGLKNPANRGRPQTALSINAAARTYIGVNVRTHECVLVLTNAMCQALAPHITLHYVDNRPDMVTQTIADGVDQILYTVKRQGLPLPSAIGVTVGGHVTSGNTVTAAPFLQWNGAVNLADMISKACQIPTAIFNDLDSLLIYESWFGAGRNVDRFAMLTIGLGIGYSLCENGREVDYPDKSYGLASHILVDPEGPTCYAGHKGCSQCLTTTSMAVQYTNLMREPETFDSFKRDLDAGNPIAQQLMNLTCFRVGAFIATIANLVMPQKILIGGESAQLTLTSLESIRNGIARYRHSRAGEVNFEILQNEWERWSLSGAARLISQSVIKRPGE